MTVQHLNYFSNHKTNYFLYRLFHSLLTTWWTFVNLNSSTDVAQMYKYNTRTIQYTDYVWHGSVQHDKVMNFFVFLPFLPTPNASFQFFRRLLFSSSCRRCLDVKQLIAKLCRSLIMPLGFMMCQVVCWSIFWLSCRAIVFLVLPFFAWLFSTTQVTLVFQSVLFACLEWMISTRNNL